MYTPEEYAGEVGGGPKTGWGHATYAAGCELANAASVKQLILHHHDPSQTDEMVREKEKRSRELFPNTIAAKEGMVLDI
jgi:ribonuclease BN (tRNA processing enzyme)